MEKKVSGNILLFYAFDVGDEVELESLQNRGALSTYELPPSPFFKDYHKPLCFRLIENEGGKTIERKDAILNKLHHFGALSFCYKIPFEGSFDHLRQKVIDVKERYDKKSGIDAKHVFDEILSDIKKPHFYNIKSDYFAVQVNPLPGKMSADDFRQAYGAKIASLLRLETVTLSEYQQDEILSSITGYYGQDMIIIDSEASFIYDDEYFEPMEFFELANIQQLELQYFDRLLDKSLNYFYQKKSHKLPLSVYIPLIGRREETPAARLARLRVDISVVTERLENTINKTGDAYYSCLYSMLVEKLSLLGWRDSINRKLEILGEVRQGYQSHHDSIRDEMLTVVIIVLIAVELIVAFMGH